jgi:hypothetical protein
MAPDELDARLRLAMFAHLDRVSAAHPEGLPSNVINSFSFEGRPMRLIVQPGIRKPADLSAALTIRTTYTPPGGQAPYEDELGADGSLRYKWRGTDPRHADNQALREAMHRQVPLAYFYPIAKGVYEAIYPVYLVDEDPRRQSSPSSSPRIWTTSICSRSRLNGATRANSRCAGSTRSCFDPESCAPTTANARCAGCDTPSSWTPPTSFPTGTCAVILWFPTASPCARSTTQGTCRSRTPSNFITNTSARFHSLRSCRTLRARRKANREQAGGRRCS